MRSKKQWCIEQVPGEQGYRYVKAKRIGSSKNTRFEFSERIAAESINGLCKGNLNIIFSPEEYHLFSDTFPKLKPDLLKLQIKKRFKELGLTMETMGYSHKEKETPGKKGHLNCLFLLDNELEEHLTHIAALRAIKKTHLYPAAVSIAGLMQAVTDKAVLVLHICQRVSQVIVVKDGCPLYSQSLAQAGPGLVEEALIPNAIDFARLNISKDHQIDDFHITKLGDARENINLESLGIDEWQPDFSSIIKCRDENAPYDFPQLYGAAFSDPVYDFLPIEFSRAWQLQSLSSKVAIVSTLCLAALIAAYYYLQPILKEQQEEYHRLLSDLTQKRQSLQQRLPEATLLNNFDRLVSIRNLSEQDFKLTTLATDLSEALPQKVVVTNLEVKRQAAGPSTDIVAPPGIESAPPELPGGSGLPILGTELSVPEKIQRQSIRIDLTCATTGSYGEVTTRFEKTAEALSEFFGIMNLNWTFNEENRSGELKCELYPAPTGLSQ